ncbi:MAG: tyrosine-type recombinase/integrase [Bacteroidales bacterium]
METRELYYRYLLNELGYSDNTLKSYKTDLRQFEEFCTSNFGDFLFKDVNAANIRRWVAHLMRSGLAPKSIRRKIAALKMFHNYLKQEGIEDTTLGQIILPKLEKRLPVFIKAKEIEAIFHDESLFDNSFEGLRDRVVMVLLYATGMRVDELITLGKEDVDFSACTIKVTGKRRKQRIIPFPKEFVPSLQEYQSASLQMNESSCFVVTSKGKRTYPMLIYRVVSRILKQMSNSGKVNPHILRHTYATHMLNNGADLNAVKELLGHASLSATEVYTHNTVERLKSVYQKSHPWSGD